MLKYTTPLASDTWLRRTSAIIARAAEMLISRIAVKFFGHIKLAAGAKVAIIVVVGFIMTDLFHFDQAGDVFVLPALGTANTGQSGMVGLPLTDTEHGTSLIPFISVRHVSGSSGRVFELGIDLVLDDDVGVLLQLLDHALE